MSQNCIYCNLIAEKDKAIFYDDPGGLFMGMWSSLPAVPGHALVIPKRHFQHFREMNDDEIRQIAFTVAKVKDHVEQADLKAVCEQLEVLSDNSKARIDTVLEALAKYNHQPPQAFNDGINDGLAAGQTVQHLHWHILPRWEGDGEGGIVQRFKDKAESL